MAAVLPAVAIGTGILSGVGALSAGAQQSAAYSFQARQAALDARMQGLRGRADALNHRRQGIAILENALRNAASINARAAAGGIRSFSGSPRDIVEYNLGKAGRDYRLTQENVELAQAQSSLVEASGRIKAAQLTSAAGAARQQGYLNAVAAFGATAIRGQRLLGTYGQE